MLLVITYLRLQSRATKTRRSRRKNAFNSVFSVPPWFVQRRLYPLPVELRLRAAAVHLERALLAGGVRANENPVLPRGQATEDARRLVLRKRKPEIRFHPGQCVRRQRYPRFHRLP